MRFLTMIKKLLQTPYLQLAIIIFLAAASVGGWLFLKRGESNDRLIVASTVSQDKPAVTSELTQKEIEDLLDLKGEAFIEIARFKGNHKSDDYWQYDGKIQQLVNELGDHHRFVIESEFRKSEIGDPYLIYDQYFRLLIGPFDKEQAAEELSRLTSIGYKDASIQQIMKSEELYPLQKDRLLFLYTKNKGPKFISDRPYLWFGYIEYVIDSKGNKIFFHSLDTYEGDRGGGKLFVADGESRKINPIDDLRTQGFVILPGTQKLLVQKRFSLSPKEPLDEHDYRGPYPVHKLREDDLARVAEEVGLPPKQLDVQYHHKGEAPDAVVSVLFELDLQTHRLKSLRVCGGMGGIFMMKDGTIYMSNEIQTAFYRNLVGLEEALGVFGKRPYYRFDPKKKRLIKMADDFQPLSNEVMQPAIARHSEAFTTIAEAGVVKLISFKGSFYIQHQCLN